MTDDNIELNTSLTSEVGNDEELRRRRAQKMVISILLAVLVVIIVVIVLVLTLRDDDDDANSNSSTAGTRDIREQAFLNMTFFSVTGRMTASQLSSFTEACTKFFELNLAGLSDVEVALVSQRLLDLPENETVTTAALDTFGLETLIQVFAAVPDANAISFTSLALTTLVTQEGSELLFFLSQISDPYFGTIETVFASSLLEDNPLAPTSSPSTDGLLPGTLAPTAALYDCNGLQRLCDKAATDVLFATMHYANFHPDEDVAVPNHNKNISEGLKAGIRGFDTEIGKCTTDGGEEVISLVKFSCNLGFSVAKHIFSEINDFLADNPKEVIIMPTRISERIGAGISLEEIHSVMASVVDRQNISMADRLYIHPGKSAPWPTLKGMIEKDKRILFFQKGGQETCDGTCMNWDDYVVETQQSFSTVEDIEGDAEQSCSVVGNQNSTGDFYSVNLHLEFPDYDASTQLNDAEFLWKHTNSCTAVTGLSANMLIVDFWSAGDTVEFVKEYNELTAVPTSSTTSPPTELPTVMPTAEPMLPVTPTAAPTVVGIGSPTAAPAVVVTPTFAPTVKGTSSPTAVPAVVTPSPSSTAPRSISPTKLLTDLPTSSPTTIIPPIENGCNGLENLCYIEANDLLYATMHYAHAYRDVVPFAPNHNQNISSALAAGVRGLNLGFGICQDQISLVRDSCIAGFSDPIPVLTEIHQFLTDNPNEVIIIPATVDSNIGGDINDRDLRELLAQVIDNNGLSMVDRLYDHGADGTSWPRLNTLISDDKRILFFATSGADRRRPQGIHDWSTYAGQTSDTFTNVADIVDDPKKACQVTAGPKREADFYELNLYLQFPDLEASTALNNGDFLRGQIETCTDETDLVPNLLVVDFWRQGDVLDVVREHNAALIAKSASPTVAPTTAQPTTSPTPEPTVEPTTAPPTMTPTTVEPTLVPTSNPTTTLSPTNEPTLTPTDPPTVTPSRGPTLLPTLPSPTALPTQ